MWIPLGASLLASSCLWIPSLPSCAPSSSWAYAFSSSSSWPWILALPSYTNTRVQVGVSITPQSLWQVVWIPRSVW